MNNLTPEQKAKYLENPLTCPFCGSANLDASGIQLPSFKEVCQDVECESCGAKWQDVFTLTNINYDKN